MYIVGASCKLTVALSFRKIAENYFFLLKIEIILSLIFTSI